METVRNLTRGFPFLCIVWGNPDPDAIARDLGALLDDEARRSALGEAGLARAKEFSWDSSAEVHLAAWMRAAG